MILLVSLLLAACASPTAEPAPTLDATQVEEMVNATLTAVAPTEAPPPNANRGATYCNSSPVPNSNGDSRTH